MVFIGLGKVNKNLIPLFVGCVFCFLNRLLNQYEGTLLFKNIVLTNIFIAISDIFSFIPYIIYKVRSKFDFKTENKDINQCDTKFEYIYEEKENIEDVQEGKEKYILLIGLVFFANYYMFVYTFELKTNMWIMYILFTSIFYYLIFKAKLYKHHYLSIVIILLAGFIIDIVLDNFKNEFSKHLLKIFLSLLRVILLSFDYVIIKYTIEKKYASPYEIGLFNGIINLILFIIFAILDYYFFKLNEYEEYFNRFNTTELLVIFGLMITQLGIYLSLFIIDKNDSPCHIFIVFIFGQIAYYLKEDKKVIVYICLAIILFFSLVFNEIIEIRICGLSHNTKKNIINRAQNEVGDSLIPKIDTLDEISDKDEIPIELSDYSSN